jgi:hypothetical protein
MKFFKINFDALGIVSSIACAIHCAILPLIISTLPLFGINIINNIWFEYGMIAIAFVIGIYALKHGYTKHHNNILPIVLFSLGIILMLLKQIFHKFMIFFLVPGVTLIVLAHWINFRYCNFTGHNKTC